MTTRYFKRLWEQSRGDAFDSWGPAIYYFEVSNEGWPTRQVEDYEAGPTLRYGPGREEDEFGRTRPDSTLGVRGLGFVGHHWDEFEQAWASAG